MTTEVSLEQTLERYARFLQRTKEMGIVGHRGGLTATRALLEACELKEGQRVLEIGCGSGYTAVTAAKEHGVSVVGMDLEPHLLARSAERAKSGKVSDRVALVRGNATSLPFANAAFDTVIVESVLGFLPDQTPALRECHRVLKPGGVFANNEVTFLTPPPQEFVAALRAAAPKVPGALAIPVDPDEHRARLAEAGFADVRVETGDVSDRESMMDQMQIDGFRALKPFFASLFNKELRSAVHKKEMARAQRIFDEHTGYGLYAARKAG